MARTKIQVGGVQQTIKRVKGMADLRTFKRIRVMTGGVMQTVFQFLTATLLSPTVTGNVSGGVGPEDVSTAYAATIVTGGTGTITYAWAEVNPGVTTWTIGSPTTANSFFIAEDVAAGDTVSGQFQCTVTDADGNSAVTPILEATASNFNAP